MKKLKIWNGRGYCAQKPSDPIWQGVRSGAYRHAYIAAYSREDARRVIEEYCGRKPPVSEIRDYFSEGCWGTSMSSITPERGLWIQIEGKADKPVRVL